jgi:hypothetical protein
LRKGGPVEFSQAAGVLTSAAGHWLFPLRHLRPMAGG